MRTLLFISTLLVKLSLFGQDSETKFPGGHTAMLAHVEREMRYPPDAAEMLLQGKVYLRLEVDSTGALTLATIERSHCPQLDAEALRLVHTFPNWIPQHENGQAKASTLRLPIRFHLPDKKGLPVDESFRNYRQAILAENGHDAFECLHPTSRNYFDSLALKIRYASESEVKTSTAYEIATVLIVRQLMDRKNLKTLNGQKLFIFLVEKGIIGKSSVGDGMPITYQLKDGVAYLQFQDDYYLHLIRNDLDWQIELTRSFDALNANIRQLAQTQGTELISFIISSVENRTKSTLSPKIWEAPFSER